MTKQKVSRIPEQRTGTRSPASSRRRTFSVRRDQFKSTEPRRSKQNAVLMLLSRPCGATIAAIIEPIGWQAYSVRGFSAGVVRRRLGLTLQSEKIEGERIYRVVGVEPEAA
jgi:uncharacterized protein DUF3489